VTGELAIEADAAVDGTPPATALAIWRYRSVIAR